MSKILQIIALSLLALVSNTFAQLSPGKLTRFHADVEGITNCTKCHELGKSVLPSKCLECHDGLKARIDAGKGFHTTPEVTGSTCVKCHSDHHGEDFELVRWPEGEKNFDHNKTGYKLEGAHSKQECRACHKAPFDESITRTDKHVNTVRTFLGLSQECTSCHQDEHRGSLDQNCLKCHNMDKWKPAQGFKHDEAKYPLTGKHQKADCIKCHKVEQGDPARHGWITKKDSSEFFARFKPLDFANCTACHEDIHRDKFGPNCEKCHVTNGWSELKSGNFDHSKTLYSLTGKHVAVTCAKCHVSGKKTEKLKFAVCMDCHRDYHKEQFASRKESGPECKFCHVVEGWIPATYSLEQHQKSRYPLTGGHLATPCALCHKPQEIDNEKIARFTYPDVSCKVCHEDIHKKEADKWMTDKGCDACHTPESWGEVKFDHSKSKYPLEGRHQNVICGSCHRIDSPESAQKVLKLTGLSMKCSGCHSDKHANQFFVADVVGECNRCHTPASWRWLRFNHNDARYKLDGAHAKVACEKCHFEELTADGVKFIRYRPIPMTCSDCHKGTVEPKTVQPPNYDGK